jgi:DNA-binding winged helix-turn-helix (wHTH) protein
MSEQESNFFYEFGRFRLDAGERVLLRDLEPVPLTPKVFDILLVLVEQGGHLVEKDDLMKRVWPDSFVEEGNLTQNVSLLRKALGESSGGAQFIETVARRGYRFVATVKTAPADGNGYAHIPSTVSSEKISPLVFAGSVASLSGDLAAQPNGNAARAETVARPSFSLADLSRHKLLLVLTAGLVVAALIGYFAIRGRAGANVDSPIESIAVLPFVDDAADSDAQYLNDKIAESLINSLSRIPKLRVVPRSVVASYKARNIDPRQIGRELNVRAVVTGRLRRYGDNQHSGRSD